MNIFQPQSKPSTPFHGFDSPVYTLYIGSEHKKLLVPQHVLTKIPPLQRLIIEGELVENEAVALEAYDPEAFASVLGMVRDGHGEFIYEKSWSACIDAYVVAWDLNLEDIQNLLVNTVKELHCFHLVQPRDFEVLYAAQIPSDCKLNKLLLHKMAHDFDAGIYRNTKLVENLKFRRDNIAQMQKLTKHDLIELCHQIAIIPSNEKCFICLDRCNFHDHALTSPCSRSGADSKANPPRFDFVFADCTKRTSAGPNQCSARAGLPLKTADVEESVATSKAFVDSGTAVKEKSNSLREGPKPTAHTKVIRWLDAGAGELQEVDNPFSSKVADGPPSSQSTPPQNTSEKQSEADIITKLSAPSTKSLSGENTVHVSTPLSGRSSRDRPQSSISSSIEGTAMIEHHDGKVLQEAPTPQKSIKFGQHSTFTLSLNGLESATEEPITKVNGVGANGPGFPGYSCKPSPFEDMKKAALSARTVPFSHIDKPRAHKFAAICKESSKSAILRQNENNTIASTERVMPIEGPLDNRSGETKSVKNIQPKAPAKETTDGDVLQEFAKEIRNYNHSLGV